MKKNRHVILYACVFINVTIIAFIIIVNDKTLGNFSCGDSKAL
jgi:hypothetical protein